MHSTTTNGSPEISAGNYPLFAQPGGNTVDVGVSPLYQHMSSPARWRSSSATSGGKRVDVRSAHQQAARNAGLSCNRVLLPGHRKQHSTVRPIRSRSHRRRVHAVERRSPALHIGEAMPMSVLTTHVHVGHQPRKNGQFLYIACSWPGRFSPYGSRNCFTALRSRTSRQHRAVRLQLNTQGNGAKSRCRVRRLAAMKGGCRYELRDFAYRVAVKKYSVKPGSRTRASR